MYTLIHTETTHYKLRADRSLVFQKSRPVSPIWVIALVGPDGHRFRLTISETCLSAESVVRFISGGVQGELSGLPTELLLTQKLLKALPDLEACFVQRGVRLYVPNKNLQLSIRVLKAFEDGMRWLAHALHGYYEEMVSIDELQDTWAETPFLGVLGKKRCLSADGSAEDFDYYTYFDSVAAVITRRRGRDPARGAQLRKERPSGEKGHGAHGARKIFKDPLALYQEKLAEIENGNAGLSEFGVQVYRALEVLAVLTKTHARLSAVERAKLLWALGFYCAPELPHYEAVGRWRNHVAADLKHHLGYGSQYSTLLSQASHEFALHPAFVCQRRTSEYRSNSPLPPPTVIEGLPYELELTLHGIPSLTISKLEPYQRIRRVICSFFRRARVALDSAWRADSEQLTLERAYAMYEWLNYNASRVNGSLGSVESRTASKASSSLRALFYVFEEHEYLDANGRPELVMHALDDGQLTQLATRIAEEWTRWLQRSYPEAWASVAVVSLSGENRVELCSPDSSIAVSAAIEPCDGIIF